MVDDGSTDGSAAIAARVRRAATARFRLVRQANGGLGSARNTGTEVASGEYLAFVDSDDVLPVERLRAAAAARCERTGSDFATGNVHRLDRVGHARRPSSSPRRSRARG